MNTKAKTPEKPLTKRTGPGSKKNGAASPNLTPIPNHPLAHLIGAFADDPAWEELMEEVRKNRELEREAEQ